MYNSRFSAYSATRKSTPTATNNHVQVSALEQALPNGLEQ